MARSSGPRVAGRPASWMSRTSPAAGRRTWISSGADSTISCPRGRSWPRPTRSGSTSSTPACSWAMPSAVWTYGSWRPRFRRRPRPGAAGDDPSSDAPVAPPHYPAGVGPGNRRGRGRPAGGNTQPFRQRGRYRRTIPGHESDLPLGPLPQELLRFHARSRAVSQPHGRAAEGWELRVRFPCGSRSRAGSQASPQGEFRHECRRLSEDHHSPRVAGLPAPLHPRAGPPRHGEGGVQGPPSRRERARAPGGRAFFGSIRAL